MKGISKMKTKLIEEANHYGLIIIGGGPGGLHVEVLLGGLKSEAKRS